MKYVLLALFVVTTTVAFCQSTEAEQVNALHKKKFEWLVKANHDSLNTLLADRVNYIHSNGWIQSRQEILDDMKSGKLKYESVNVESSEVNVMGTTAIVTGRGVFSGVMNGITFSVKLLYTEIYIKIDSNWKLVGRHACKV